MHVPRFELRTLSLVGRGIVTILTELTQFPISTSCKHFLKHGSCLTGSCLTLSQNRMFRSVIQTSQVSFFINPLTPNDHYSGRTAPLTSKGCILHIYSTNIGTEYFKHGIYIPFLFFLFKMQFVS